MPLFPSKILHDDCDDEPAGAFLNGIDFQLLRRVSTASPFAVARVIAPKSGAAELRLEPFAISYGRKDFGFGRSPFCESFHRVRMNPDVQRVTWRLEGKCVAVENLDGKCSPDYPAPSAVLRCLISFHGTDVACAIGSATGALPPESNLLALAEE